jgi:hypothetical protein
MKAKRKWSGNRANPDLAKQAGRACAMGPKHPTTSSAALALQASLPQAKTWSCLNPNLAHRRVKILVQILLLTTARRWNSKQTMSLDQSLNNAKSATGHNNQQLWAMVVIINNQPAIPEMQTTINMQRDDCALQRQTHAAPHSICRREGA